MAGAQTVYGERAVYGDVGLRKVLIISVIFHLFVLVGLPLMSKLFEKPKKFERPKTFQLVQLPPAQPKPAPKTPVEPTPVEPPPKPTPPPPAPEPTPAPVPKPTPPTPTPKPAPPQTKAEPKPTPKQETVSKPVEEEVDPELVSLMSAMSVPAAKISAPGTPPHPYIDPGVRGKIERNLEKISYNANIEVVVSFEIHSDGSAHNVRITSSSGDATVDKWGENAVKRASPFGKLPWPDKNMIEINIALRPTMRK